MSSEIPLKTVRCFLRPFQPADRYVSLGAVIERATYERLHAAASRYGDPAEVLEGVLELAFARFLRTGRWK